MEHGGKRPNAGRRSGVPNRANARREQLISQSGLTPIDVMVGVMRDAFAIAQHELKQKKPNEHKLNGLSDLHWILRTGPHHSRTLGFPQSITAQRSMPRN